MYFLFQNRLVTIYQIEKTIEENHGDIFPQIVIKFEFWDTWENGSVILTPRPLYWNYFVHLAHYFVYLILKLCLMNWRPNMIHLTNRNLQVRIGSQNFELLAVYNVSAISIMTFVKKPMTNIYRLLTIFINDPQFAEFTIFLAYK